MNIQNTRFLMLFVLTLGLMNSEIIQSVEEENSELINNPGETTPSDTLPLREPRSLLDRLLDRNKDPEEEKAPARKDKSTPKKSEPIKGYKLGGRWIRAFGNRDISELFKSDKEALTDYLSNPTSFAQRTQEPSVKSEILNLSQSERGYLIKDVLQSTWDKSTNQYNPEKFNQYATEFKKLLPEKDQLTVTPIFNPTTEELIKFNVTITTKSERELLTDYLSNPDSFAQRIQEPSVKSEILNLSRDERGALIRNVLKSTWDESTQEYDLEKFQKYVKTLNDMLPTNDKLSVKLLPNKEDKLTSFNLRITNSEAENNKDNKKPNKTSSKPKTLKESLMDYLEGKPAPRDSSDVNLSPNEAASKAAQLKKQEEDRLKTELQKLSTSDRAKLLTQTAHDLIEKLKNKPGTKEAFEVYMTKFTDILPKTDLLMVTNDGKETKAKKTTGTIVSYKFVIADMANFEYNDNQTIEQNAIQLNKEQNLNLLINDIQGRNIGLTSLLKQYLEKREQYKALTSDALLTIPTSEPITNEQIDASKANITDGIEDKELTTNDLKDLFNRKIADNLKAHEKIANENGLKLTDEQIDEIVTDDVDLYQRVVPNEFIILKDGNSVEILDITLLKIKLHSIDPDFLTVDNPSNNNTRIWLLAYDMRSEQSLKTPVEEIADKIKLWIRKYEPTIAQKYNI